MQLKTNKLYFFLYTIPLFFVQLITAQNSITIEQIQEIHIKDATKDSLFVLLDSISENSLSSKKMDVYVAAQKCKGDYFLKIRNFDETQKIEKLFEQIDTNLISSETAYDMYFFIGQSRFFYGDKNSSLDYYKKANLFAHKLNDEGKIITSSLQIGVNSYYLDKNADAHKFTYQAYQYFEKQQDTAFMIYCLSNMAAIYNRIGMAQKARETYFKAINLDLQFDAYSTLQHMYSNLALVYSDLLEDYDSALYYHRLAQNYLDKNNKYTRAIIEANMGIVYSQMGVLDSAIYYLDKALIHDNYLANNSFIYAGVLSSKGHVLLLQKKYSEAFIILRKSVEISENNNYYTFLVNALNSLITLDTIYGDYQKAFYRTIQRSDAINDKNFEEQKLEVMKQDLESQIQEGEIENKKLLSDNQYSSNVIVSLRYLIYIVFVVLIGIAIFTIVQYRNNKRINLLLKELQNKNRILEEQKEQLNQSNISKTQVLSVLGHDLKSPFNTLIGMLNMLNEDWDVISEKEKQEFIKSIYVSSQRTYQLLEDVLLFSKANLTMKEKKWVHINLLQLMDEVVQLFEKDIQNKELNITTSGDLNLNIQSEPFLIKQILQNFLTNAIKFTKRGGYIKLSATNIATSTYICVEDNGIGISDENMKNIFTSKFSFNRKGTENEKSTGLGLVLVTEYAKLLNAKLEVKSKENLGSTFCLVIQPDKI